MSDVRVDCGHLETYKSQCLTHTREDERLLGNSMSDTKCFEQSVISCRDVLNQRWLHARAHNVRVWLAADKQA